MAIPARDSAVATAMDGATAMQWKARWQSDGNNGDGCHDGKGDGWCNGDTAATEGATVTQWK